MAILYHIDGVAEAKRFLGGAVERARNPRLPLKFIGEEMLFRTQKRMRAGVDINGRPFKKSARAEQAGGQTLFDRGALAGSANYQVTDTALDVFSTDKRARVHEDGLTILPKHGKFLTIPIRATGGLFGMAGGSAANANRAGYQARDYPKGSTFFLRRGSALFLMQRVGKVTSDEGGVRYRGMKRSSSQGALRALFILVKKVEMVQREWLGFGADDATMATEEIGRYLSGDEK
jgi:phage gpG-like protein